MGSPESSGFKVFKVTLEEKNTGHKYSQLLERRDPVVSSRPRENSLDVKVP